MPIYYIKEWSFLNLDIVFLYDLTAWGFGPWGNWQVFDKTAGFDLGPFHLSVSKRGYTF
jgi:hypothetical protein